MKLPSWTLLKIRKMPKRSKIYAKNHKPCQKLSNQWTLHNSLAKSFKKCSRMTSTDYEAWRICGRRESRRNRWNLTRFLKQLQRFMLQSATRIRLLGILPKTSVYSVKGESPSLYLWLDLTDSWQLAPPKFTVVGAAEKGRSNVRACCFDLRQRWRWYTRLRSSQRQPTVNCLRYRTPIEIRHQAYVDSPNYVYFVTLISRQRWRVTLYQLLLPQTQWQHHCVYCKLSKSCERTWAKRRWYVFISTL